MSLLGAPGVWRLSAGPRCVKSICLSGFEVSAHILGLSVDIRKTRFNSVLTCFLGTTTPTQPLIETDAEALRYRVQPQVQIVYGYPFKYSSLLMGMIFELRAARCCAL